jgi:hypothetical protein
MPVVVMVLCNNWSSIIVLVLLLVLVLVLGLFLLLTGCVLLGVDDKIMWILLIKFESFLEMVDGGVFVGDDSVG